MTAVVYPEIWLRPVEGMYQLQSDAVYLFRGKRLVVPAGFKFDGATIPRVFWRLMDTPFHPCYMPAALPHDYCYASHQYDKEWADDLFRELLIAHKVADWRVSVMYKAVRYYGDAYWQADEPLPAKEVYGGGDSFVLSGA